MARWAGSVLAFRPMRYLLRGFLVVAILATVLMAAPPAPGAGLSTQATDGRNLRGQCGTEQCPNPWDCWTASVTYRVNTAPELATPIYQTRFIEFLHEPGNVWQYREDAECHARKAALEGIMGPLNFPDNDQRIYIPPSAIDNIRIWKITMPH